MEKIDWKRKLTSRKFWAALAGFIAMLVVFVGGSQELSERITALIMAGASVIAYILAEGFTDTAREKATENNYYVPAETDEQEVGEG